MGSGNSLDHNPPNASRHITSGGSDWLWAVTALMALSDLAMLTWAFSRARGTRLFHQIGIIILTTATIAYFAMASDLGAAPAEVEFGRGTPGVTRQIFYVRYIQWFITLPLLLLELLLATGLTLSDIFTAIFMGWVLVICGLVGAFVITSYKWGFYVIGVFGLFYIWWVLLGHGPRSTFAAGGAVRSGYLRCASYFSFILMLYPIAWACSEGGNVISPTGEMIWYGILDLFAGPIFLFFFLYGLREVDMAAFGLTSGKYTDTGYGAGYGAGPGMATAGAANGVTTGAAPAATNGVATAPSTTAAAPGATAANQV